MIKSPWFCLWKHVKLLSHLCFSLVQIYTALLTLSGNRFVVANFHFLQNLSACYFAMIWAYPDPAKGAINRSDSPLTASRHLFLMKCHAHVMKYALALAYEQSSSSRIFSTTSGSFLTRSKNLM